MTAWEWLRMACYVIGAPLLIDWSLEELRNHNYPLAVFAGAFSLMLLWYMVEIAIASTGTNTREYRVIGTPMVVAFTVALVVRRYMRKRKR